MADEAWLVAFDLLSEADRSEELDVDALEMLADAAHLADRPHASRTLGAVSSRPASRPGSAFDGLRLQATHDLGISLVLQPPRHGVGERQLSGDDPDEETGRSR